MKIWFISDTHHKHGFLKLYPPEDIGIVIHCGDVGVSKIPAINYHEVMDFIVWYKSLPYDNKIWIAGNHDTSIEAGLVKPKDHQENGVIYLENSGVLCRGLNIWGSPFTPTFNNWAFNRDRGKLHKLWDTIPYNTNIVVTHGPPFGILDFAKRRGTKVGELVGCKALRTHMEKYPPIVHAFGHVHECAGATMKIVGQNTSFINAGVVDLKYNIINNGVTFTL